MADGAHVSAEIAKSRSGVNDSDAVRIRERDLKTGGVAAELLKAGVTDWDGTARTIKFEFHRIVFVKLSLRFASIKLQTSCP